METGYFKEDILLHFCSSMISGLATTIASMPVDIIKTRSVTKSSSQHVQAEISEKYNSYYSATFVFSESGILPKKFLLVSKQRIENLKITRRRIYLLFKTICITRKHTLILICVIVFNY